MQDRLRSFGVWWHRELRVVLDGGERAGRPPDPLTLIALHEDHASVFVRRSGTTERVGHVRLDAQGRIDANTLKGMTLPGTTALTLPPEAAVVATMRAPTMSPEDTRALISHQIDRLTPFRRDRVHFAWAREEAGQREAEGTIAVTVLPKALVEPFFEALAGSRLTPAYAAVTQGDGTVQTLIPLEDDAQGGDRGRGGDWKAYSWALALLLAACAVWPIAERVQLKEDLGAQAQALAQEVRDAREEIAQAVGRLHAHRALSELVQGRRTVGETLAQLSERLPAGTWARSVEIEPGRVTLLVSASDVDEAENALARIAWARRVETTPDGDGHRIVLHDAEAPE